MNSPGNQIDAGAVGITSSKVDEALVFINNGIRSVTVAYPLVVDSKLDRLIAAARAHDVDLRLIVDSPAGVDAIAQVAGRHQKQISIFLKIDVGLHRCGLTEDDPGLVGLVQKIVQEPDLNFVGNSIPRWAYLWRQMMPMQREKSPNKSARL